MSEKRKIIKIIHQIIFISVVVLSGVGSIAYAVNSSAQRYEYWKLQQEKHDLRLQNQKSSSKGHTLQHAALPTEKTLIARPNAQNEQVLGTAVRVNINTATAQELSAKLDSIGVKKAKEIITYRNKHGKFNKVEDLKNVKGIGPKIFEKNRDRIKLTD